MRNMVYINEGKEKSPEKLAGEFFSAFFSFAGILLLIMLIIVLEILEVFGLIEINIPFL